MWNSRVVILDEPTAALGVAQTEQVLELVQPARRAGARRRPHLAQPPRHLRGRRPDHRAAARPQRRRLRPARRRPSRRSSTRSPPASPTKVAGIPTEHGDRRDDGGRRRRSTPSPPSNDLGAIVRRRFEALKAGDVGTLPIILGLIGIVAFFYWKNENYLSAGNFTNLMTQMAGVTTIAIGVVFVLLLGEIDLSIGYVSGIAGVVVAQLQIPDESWQVKGVLAIAIARHGHRADRRRCRARSSRSSASRRSSSRWRACSSGRA